MLTVKLGRRPAHKEHIASVDRREKKVFVKKIRNEDGLDHHQLVLQGCGGLRGVESRTQDARQSLRVVVLEEGILRHRVHAMRVLEIDWAAHTRVRRFLAPHPVPGQV
jgi:hypothetical protein